MLNCDSIESWEEDDQLVHWSVECHLKGSAVETTDQAFSEVCPLDVQWLPIMSHIARQGSQLIH